MAAVHHDPDFVGEQIRRMRLRPPPPPPSGLRCRNNLPPEPTIMDALRVKLKHADEVARKVRRIITVGVAVSVVATAVGSLIWYLIEPRLGPVVSALDGLPEFMNRTDRQLENLTRELDELALAQPISEWDVRRSRVFEPCRPGQFCLAEFRFRRTASGLNCDAPSVQGYMTNHYGRKYAVETDVTPIRASNEWSIVPVSFKLPPSVLPGTGDFWLVLTYRCGDRVRTDKTTVIRFEIKS
jgi:hypothetical protein